MPSIGRAVSHVDYKAISFPVNHVTSTPFHVLQCHNLIRQQWEGRSQGSPGKLHLPTTPFWRNTVRQTSLLSRLLWRFKTIGRSITSTTLFLTDEGLGRWTWINVCTFLGRPWLAQQFPVSVIAWKIKRNYVIWSNLYTIPWVLSNTSGFCFVNFW